MVGFEPRLPRLGPDRLMSIWGGKDENERHIGSRNAEMLAIQKE
jgi:hypothetical protein